MNSEFLELRKLYSQEFQDGLRNAKGRPDFASVDLHQKKVIVANEVSNLVWNKVGTYGSTEEIRTALNDYVEKLAEVFILAGA